MAKKQKYYVVWAGVKPGIYLTWDECKSQVNAFQGARYQSFESPLEAEKAYLTSAPKAAFAKKDAPKSGLKSSKSNIIWDSISVDAACSGNPGAMEYRGVNTRTKEELFRQGPFLEGTNNIGEFLGLVHGIAFLKKLGKLDTPIYTDSKTGIAWLKAKKAKTTLEETKRNQPIFDLIERAESWLESNTYSNPIIKWKTEDWGEIPADFGRK